jgi:hypothetical protein
MGFLIVRSLAAGPAQAPRDIDVIGAKREAKPPKGTSDEREPLAVEGLVGGNGVVEPADRETKVAAAAPGL